MTTIIVAAFAAGMVPTVNPCGFAMLPAYLGYFIGLDDGHVDRAEAVRRALVIGGVVSAGVGGVSWAASAAAAARRTSAGTVLWRVRLMGTLSLLRACAPGTADFKCS